MREADEYNTSHIPGAVNVSRGILEFKLTNDPAFEDRALNLVIYCKNSGLFKALWQPGNEGNGVHSCSVHCRWH